MTDIEKKRRRSRKAQKKYNEKLKMCVRCDEHKAVKHRLCVKCEARRRYKESIDEKD